MYLGRMEYFLTWLFLASIQLAATVSPGPAFALTIGNAARYDRKTGVLTSLGLSLGVAALLTLVIVGIAAILTQSIILYSFIKYAGAAYLIYIGIKSLKAKKQERLHLNPEEKTLDQPKTLSVFQAVRLGFLTNILNPKAYVFFTAFFAQFIGPDKPMWFVLCVAATSVIIEFLWFSVVTVFLTNRTVRHKFYGFKHWIERVCGGFLIVLGLKIAVSKA